MSGCGAVQCNSLSMIKLYLLWWFDSKFRHHINDQSCHGVRSAHGVFSRADVCSSVFLLQFFYRQGLTFYSASSSWKLIKKLCPGDHWRGISDDPALGETDVFTHLSVYWSREKGNVWKSCNRGIL